MNPCQSPPAKLHYIGPMAGSGNISAVNSQRLGRPDEIILAMDLAKEQLKDSSNGPFIRLFSSTDRLRKLLTTMLVTGSVSRGEASKWFLCEIDSSKLVGTTIYKVSDIVSSMGVIAQTELPDYLAQGSIPRAAIKVKGQGVVL